jgi:hypothetical protein
VVRNPSPPPLHTPEAEFLDVFGTKVVRVFLFAIHSHLTNFTPFPAAEQK